MKKKIINTKNREIYDKLNALKYSPNVFLEDVKPFQINKILRNINSDKNVVDVKFLDGVILLKKLNPINYEIYFKGNF